MHSIAPQSAGIAAADAELFGTAALIDILKVRVSRAQLGLPEPASREALVLIDNHFDANFGELARRGTKTSMVIFACTHELFAADLRLYRLDIAIARHVCRKTSRSAVFYHPCVRLQSRGLVSRRLFPVDSDEDVDTLAVSIADDMEVSYVLLEALIRAQRQVILACASERLEHEIAIVSELRHRSRAASSSQVATALARRVGGWEWMYAAKVDTVLHAMNRLRDRCTHVDMDRTCSGDMRAYVLHEEDLNFCVEELSRSLQTWGEECSFVCPVELEETQFH